MFFDYARLEPLTHDYLILKKRFFPNLAYRSQSYLDAVLAEVKGSNLRRSAARGGRNAQRQVFGFLDRVLDLLDLHSVKVVARIYTKAIGGPFVGRAVYSASVQNIIEYYEQYLSAHTDYGICLLDARLKHLNTQVAHSIFTQKFSTARARYPRVVELPAFVHSDNHVGIQLADLLSSAILFPIASVTYCSGHVNNVHVQPGFATIKTRYAARIKALQFRYFDAQQRFRGGITVSDAIARRSSALM
ncbi:MAG: DUF3800 domain-containing protein, partial [Candidatus Eremiobacteraeota bacterium]|nr:DUF3800 domain-containing protein [Candidatus Eremiobacteraeota bacterium]